MGWKEWDGKDGKEREREKSHPSCPLSWQVRCVCLKLTAALSFVVGPCQSIPDGGYGCGQVVRVHVVVAPLECSAEHRSRFRCRPGTPRRVGKYAGSCAVGFVIIGLAPPRRGLRIAPHVVPLPTTPVRGRRDEEKKKVGGGLRAASAVWPWVVATVAKSSNYDAWAEKLYSTHLTQHTARQRLASMLRRTDSLVFHLHGAPCQTHFFALPSSSLCDEAATTTTTIWAPRRIPLVYDPEPDRILVGCFFFLSLSILSFAKKDQLDATIEHWPIPTRVVYCSMCACTPYCARQ